MTLWWYIPAGKRVLPLTFYNPLLPKEGEGGHSNLLSLESLSYYFINLVNQQIYMYFWIFISAFIIILWYHRKTILGLLNTTNLKTFFKIIAIKDQKAIFILALWIVVPYILLSMSHVKNSRYVTPYIPAIALIIAYGVLLPRPRWKKAVAIIIIVIIGFSQLFLLSFGTNEIEDELTINTPTGELLLFGQKPLGRCQYSSHPLNEDWREEEILYDIYIDVINNRSLFIEPGETVKIGTVEYFDGYRFYAVKNHYPFTFYTGISYYDKEDFYKEFPNFTYIIILNSTFRPNSKLVMDIINFNGTGFLSRDFLLHKDYRINDDKSIQVFKRFKESSDYCLPDPLPELIL